MTQGSDDASIDASSGADGSVQAILRDILNAGLRQLPQELTVAGSGDLPGVFPVIDFAVATIGATGIAVADLMRLVDARHRAVVVDRRLASFWFASSLRPQGWTLPSPWDAIAGDYATSDGWIRLHTNAPHHRRAALSVLGVEADRASVTTAVARWRAEALEEAVVKAGGGAATMHSADEWLASMPGQSVAREPLIAWETAGEPSPLSPSDDPTKPLKGLRVLDLTRVLAGPVATRLLGCLGADVLRIDPPDWTEPAVEPEVMLAKRTARLDLRSAPDRERFVRLLEDADVLVHGYRPGALAGLGFDASALHTICPKLIEISLDAYGWTGPWRERRGFDSLVQMSSGIAHAGMRGLGREQPTPLPVQALDHATGYLMAFAALSAVANRLLGGHAVRARLSLARTAVLLLRAPGGRSEPIMAESNDDLNEQIEITGWGPARRLKFPLTIEGIPLAADQPAMPVGSHEAQW